MLKLKLRWIIDEISSHISECRYFGGYQKHFPAENLLTAKVKHCYKKGRRTQTHRNRQGRTQLAVKGPSITSSLSKTIFIMAVMNIERRSKKKQTEEGPERKGNRARGWTRIYSRRPETRSLRHQSPCVLSTLKYCDRSFPVGQGSRGEVYRQFFRLLKRPLGRRSPSAFLLPINSLDF